MKRTLVIISHRTDFFRNIKYHLNAGFEIIEKNTSKTLEHLFRSKSISCVIAYIDCDYIPEKHYFSKVSNNFPLIPLLAVIYQNNLELARECGQLGFEKVISLSEMSLLEEQINQLLLKKEIRISLQDLGINNENKTFSPEVQKALKVIENDYIEINGVAQLAEKAGASECVLSREFQKHELPGPKRLLMYLKVYHASLLMQNKGLSIREISALSGFSSDKRLAECFLRVHHKLPGEFRSQMKENGKVILNNSLCVK